MTKQETYTKAIKFELLPITKSKKNIIKILSDDYRHIYNFVSPLLPGMRKDGKPPGNFGLYNSIFKKMMDGRSIIHSDSVLYAIQDATANFATMDTQKNKIKKSVDQLVKKIDNNTVYCEGRNFNKNKTDRILKKNKRKLAKVYKKLNISYPIMRRSNVKFGNKQWKFINYNNKQYIEIPTIKKGNRYQKMLLPIKESDHYNELIKTVPKWGTCQLFPDRNLAILTITLPKMKPTPKFGVLPDYYAGIDIGVNNLAVLSIIKADDNKVVFTKLWGGKEAKHIRTRFYNHRRDMQSIKRYDIVKRGKGHESLYMENVNHNISREIIEIVNKYSNCMVIMENLSGFKRKVRIQWNRYQLQEMITYKGVAYGIKSYKVDPKFTSQQCSKCGHIDKESRDGINFECVECGFQLNADVNASKNLAMKGKFVITTGNKNHEKKVNRKV